MKKKKKKFFFDFISTFKGPESGKEKNRKSGVRTFENLPDFRTGRDVRLSPIKDHLCTVTFGLMYGLYSRAASNQELPMIARIRYFAS